MFGNASVDLAVRTTRLPSARRRGVRHRVLNPQSAPPAPPPLRITADSGLPCSTGQHGRTNDVDQAGCAPGRGPGASPQAILRVAEEAERSGLDSVWSWERLMRPTRPSRWGPGGRWRCRPTLGCAAPGPTGAGGAPRAFAGHGRRWIPAAGSPAKR